MKIKILLITLFVGIVGLFYSFILEKDQQNLDISNDSIYISENSNTNSNNEINSKMIYIHIYGEIKKEGVYEIEENSIVNDLVKKAGGFTKEADTNYNNLARRLEDGEQIYVPARNEAISLSKEKNIENKININSNNIDELLKIKGVGQKKAELILEYRKINGNFKNIDELKNIKGIKDKFFNKIKDDICVK